MASSTAVPHALIVAGLLALAQAQPQLADRALGSGESTSTTSPSPTGAASSPPAAATTAGAGGNGPTNQPLLFFVALGFGVVFTNLWIIVGVKYCFRYNQRNRQARPDEVNDAIDLAAMRRSGRRRREKKLMSMEEVNERFPLIKYKTWSARRESEGLLMTGGVAAPTTRPASLSEAEAAQNPDEARTSAELTVLPVPSDGGAPEITGLPESTPAADSSAEKAEAGAAKSSASPPDGTALNLPPLEETKTTASTIGENGNRATTDDDDDDEHEGHIHTALPAQYLSHPGDSCSICIDSLEEEDDVRGLTCGHAFHASCLDPWLTGRRACCPLCKADYYVPKPRPEGEAAAEAERLTRARTHAARQRGPLPAVPQPTWVGTRSFRFVPTAHHSEQNRYAFPVGRRERRRRQDDGTNEAPRAAEPDNPTQGGGRRFVAPRFSNPFRSTSENREVQSRPLTTPRSPTSAPDGVTATSTENSRWRPRVANPFNSTWMRAMRLPGRSNNHASANGTEEAATTPTPTPTPTPGQLEAAVR
ncbi:MAG: hypothetical protein M1832_001747 [Thelocarpon impressellum]|nr:MAG: hypothetical protein M1832_001747 [Thelocarpon impressellum]